MKYIIRAVKYYLSISVILCIVILIMIQMHYVEADIDKLFVNGYKSVGQIAALLAVFAAIYPRLGYSTKHSVIPGEDDEIIPAIIREMEDSGYVLKDRDGNTLRFTKKSPLSRVLKVWEDTLTFTRTMDGYDIEGLTRDNVRIASMLQYKLSGKSDEN